MVHLLAVIYLYFDRRPAGRIHPRRFEIHRSLTAITAAVVGVILNLALFFGYHVWWSGGFAGKFDWIAAAMTLAAALALFKFKRSVMQVIAVSAVVGLVLRTLV
jgi:chromate transporter